MRTTAANTSGAEENEAHSKKRATSHYAMCDAFFSIQAESECSCREWLSATV